LSPPPDADLVDDKRGQPHLDLLGDSFDAWNAAGRALDRAFRSIALDVAVQGDETRARRNTDVRRVHLGIEDELVHDALLQNPIIDHEILDSPVMYVRIGQEPNPRLDLDQGRRGPHTDDKLLA